ncbi:dipeptidase [Bryobacter aggregatus]|uniref:dipeptidase n=1 Tax=Bryobacter aggregatus TaxID=360054 RepID=UPI0004E1BF94|nr:dipeptidase [Bryobacter aggregatus]
MIRTCNRSLPAIVLAGFCLLSVGSSAQQKKVWTDAEVMKIHNEAYLIDLHNDIPTKTLVGQNFMARGGGEHTDIFRMKEGGVGAQFFAAYVPASHVATKSSAHHALAMIDTIKEDIVKKSAGQFALAITAADILNNKKLGRRSALIGIEGGHAIEDDPRLLRQFYALGTRYMTLTWSNTNGWADSSGDISNPRVKHHGGLTDLGRQIVLEMNRLGMMVDISHVADSTFYDAVKISKAPLLASHSSCRALCNAGRNMTDDMIKALARTNGVMGINFNCDFLNQKAKDASPATHPDFIAKRDRINKTVKDEAEAMKQVAQLTAQYRANTPRATLQDVVDHIDHVVQLVGVDHVALGSDFDGVSCTPVGLEDVSKFPKLTRALLEKGYTPQMITKIYHGNLIRLMQDVEKTATSMK